MQIWTAEIAAVHEEVLVAKAFPCCIRTACEAVDFHDRGLGTDIHYFIGDIGSKDILNPEFQRLGRAQDIDILAIVSQCESYIRTSEGHSDEFCDDMLELDIVRLEELPPCRDIVEKVANAEIGSSCGSGFIGRDMLRVGEIHLTSDLILLATGLERDFCHGSY